MKLRFLMIPLVIFLFSCQKDSQTAKTIDMYNQSGDLVGTAKLSEQPDGVKVKLTVEGLTPGFHGVHVHEFAKCEGPDFKSAGNHFNPEGKQHGLMHPEGAHIGDLPNVEADSAGLVEAELTINQATLLKGKFSLVDGEGTALIITSEQDDGVSQPSGNSGERLLCGEIEKKSTDDKKQKPTDPTQFKEEEKEE